MRFIPGGPSRYRHQRLGLHRLIKQRGVGALLFDAGTGKTAAAIDYACVLTLASKQPTTKVLVAAPLAAVDTWLMQMALFASPQVDYVARVLDGSILDKARSLAVLGGRPYRGRDQRVRTMMEAILGDGSQPVLEMTVLNLDTFSSRGRVGSRTMADVVRDGVLRYAPDLLIVDEAHRLKGEGSNVSRLMYRIGLHVPRRVILTGTVMPHSPLDVFGIWRFLDPYAFGTRGKEASFGDFKSRYADLGGYMGKEVRGFRNLDHMQEVMSRLAVVARKEDVLDLPPVTEVAVPVHLSEAEALAYDQMRAAMAAQLDDGTWATVPNALARIMRLRQITSGYLPDDHHTARVLGTSKVDTIASLVADTLAGEHRVVVFCQFRAEISALADLLAKDPDTVVETITGDTDPATRAQVRARFGSDDPARIVLIAQVAAMSLAVNELVTASHAIFGSLSSRRDDLVQAKARLDRSGQERAVTFWFALAPGTIDEVIMTSHRDRTSLEDAVLAHVRSAQNTLSSDTAH